MSNAQKFAIVGLNGRFPGARDVEEYWSNLKSGVESITTWSAEELIGAGVEPGWANNPAYVKARPTFADLEKFDARFFRFTPREAEVRDPQHRMFLESAYSALEDAGYDPFSVPGRVGVFAGSAPNFYEQQNVRHHRDRVQAVGQMAVSIGNGTDYIAPTVSYKLGLSGPSVNVVTACSSSLVAVHLACRALMNGECETAVAGGVEVELPVVSGYWWMEGGIYSKSGHCRPFDHEADGTIFGTGVGTVVVRRYEDAVRDHDHIYAVILGSAVNNDAADRAGFTAPSISGQRALMEAAFDDADVDPASIGYVEAHGTGTIVGDPIEITALSETFAARGVTDESQCLIGSVKGNIGHMGPAAGVAGLIKAVMMVREGVVPPLVNFTEANPKIQFDRTPFAVNTEPAPWPQPAGKRRATVSSYGVGGTNAFAIVEEPPKAPIGGRARTWQVFPLSARTENALDAAAANLGATCTQAVGQWNGRKLANAAFTLATGRPQLPVRRAVVASDTGAAAKALTGFDTKKLASVHNGQAGKTETPVVFVFPGQGSQHLGAAADLYGTEQVFTVELDRVAALIEKHIGIDLREAIRDEKSGIDVNQTQIAQPLLFAVEYALARLWLSWGVTPAAMVGHSVGEFVAATLAGVFSLEDAARLVAERGRLVQEMEPGRMLAVMVAEDQLGEMPDGVSVAATNAPEVTVVSGPHEAIEAYAAQLDARGVGFQALHTSHAFHSAMMDPAVAPLTELVAQTERNAPTVPIVSNLTGDYLTVEQAADPTYWAQHLRSAVRFSESISRLMEDGHTTFLEVGPSQALTALIRPRITATGGCAVPSLHHERRAVPDGRVMASALAELWCHGVSVDWAAFYGDETRCKVTLPTYPFERQTFWLEPPTAAAASATAAAAQARVRSMDPLQLFRPHWVEKHRTATNTGPGAGTGAGAGTGRRWLLFASSNPLVDRLISTLRRSGETVMTVSVGEEFTEAGPGRFLIRPGEKSDHDLLLEQLSDEDRLPDRVLHTWLLDAPTGLSDHAVQSTQDRGFFSLLGLTQALAKHAEGRDVHIDLISAGAFDISGEEEIEAARTTVQGLGNLIPQEIPHLSYRHIDLRAGAAKGGQTGGEALLREIFADPVDDKVALRGHKRWVWSYDRVETRSVTEVPAVLRERGVYLITGGLGGIGLAVAEDLARLAAARVVLTSRSPFPERSEWDAIVAAAPADDVLAKRIAALRRIEALGGQAMVVQADTADEAAMRAAVEQAEEAFGPINGVLHSAGVPAGGMMAVKARAEAERIMAPKIGGLLALDRIFQDRLDFLVLFSSISSVATDFGLSDYAAANAMLDAYAQARADDDTHVVSINWGAWSEVGMAVDTAASAPGAFRSLQANAAAAASGTALAETAGAAGTVAAADSTANTVSTVDSPLASGQLSTENGRHVFTAEIAPHSHWVLSEHLIGDRQVWPGVAHVELVRAIYQAAVPVPDGKAVEICDVLFQGVLEVSAPRKLRVTFEPANQADDEYEFTVSASAMPGRPDSWTVYVTGRVRLGEAVGRTVDIDQLWAASTEADPFTFGVGLDYVPEAGLDWWVRFGWHWWTVQERRTTPGTTIARLALPPEFVDEIGSYVLHPSLLDCATALAVDLRGLLRPGQAFLPFSYGKLTVHAPLTPRLFSVIKHMSDPGSALQSFDIDLVDEDGRLLAEIAGFSVRLLAADKPLDTTPQTAAAPEAVAISKPAAEPSTETAPGIDPSSGLRTEAGLQALRQILAERLGPQIVVLHEDLDAKLERVKALTGDRLTQSQGSMASVSGDTRKARPAKSAKPSKGKPSGHDAGSVIATLLDFWRDTLGDDDLGVDDDFFDSGGNSLVAVQLGARIRAYFDIKLPIVVLFEHPTVEQLAVVVEAQLKNRLQGADSAGQTASASRA
ncbi:SDR family NAD(P)-dependent oxidoreductase [Catenulispora sp. NL8]|uniref:SDR family NAD(P)-dependent oxidoreductase n=1 Tax=Catenulispora pinistramenti TaxID=2705254 RepID=A0ABS5L419_9ACTN|nr:type I polyketide synthase [Catenulispora pinistramenti]MBS2552884.1 SDR family NAD(P)-dependent oxidoreductase [Catenulispora pinistramenti]